MMTRAMRWRLARRLNPGRVGDGEEGFALIYALLMMIVITLLATGVLALVVQQVKPTQFAKKREQTLNTAEAGLEATLNRIRNSVSGPKTGNLGLLPRCSGTNPYATVTGALDSAGLNTYTTQVYYLTTDPSGMTFGSTAFTSALLPCNPLQAQPRYAYLVSAGSGAALPGQAVSVGNRTLHATYQFSTQNNQVTGGRIYPYTSVDANLNPVTCWDVGSEPVLAGTPVTLQACGGANTANSSNVSQSFTYEPNLTYQWTGDNAAASGPLCITRDGTNIPKLAQCTTATVPWGPSPNGYAGTPLGQTPVPGSQGALEVQQEWGVNGYGVIAVPDQSNTSGTLTNTCFSPNGGSTAAGTPMVLASCVNSTTSSQAIRSDSQVGAGEAVDTKNPTGYPSAATLQLTNYKESGRCLDITGTDPGNPSEIDYPCKEEPIGQDRGTDWNQEWSFTADVSGGNTGTLSTLRPADNIYYCLDSNPGGYVRAFPCNKGGSTTGTLAVTGANDTAPTQQWTFTGNKGDADYADSFNITNGAGNCLSLNFSYLPYGWSTPIMESCSGSDQQKWNAPPGPVHVKLGDVTEQQH